MRSAETSTETDPDTACDGLCACELCCCIVSSRRDSSFSVPIRQKATGRNNLYKVGLDDHIRSWVALEFGGDWMRLGMKCLWAIDLVVNWWLGDLSWAVLVWYISCSNKLQTFEIVVQFYLHRNRFCSFGKMLNSGAMITYSFSNHVL